MRFVLVTSLIVKRWNCIFESSISLKTGFDKTTYDVLHVYKLKLRIPCIRARSFSCPLSETR